SWTRRSSSTASTPATAPWSSTSASARWRSCSGSRPATSPAAPRPSPARARVTLPHRWYCGSSRWAAVVEGSLLPWVLDGVELGPHLLEVGPGPGLTTDGLRRRAARLTGLELAPALAAGLGRRLRGTGVRVVRGDGGALPFRDGASDA